jgi:hypothetical protein
MDIYTETKEYLDPTKPADLHRLAASSGVPYHTILKIKNGETKNPGVLTVQKLLTAIRAEQGNAERTPTRRDGDKNIIKAVKGRRSKLTIQ